MGESTPPDESMDSLKRKVEDAKLRLDFASQYVEEVDRDYRSGLTLLADPAARDRAMQAKRSANAEHLRVVKIYEDFITRGKASHNGAGPQLHGTSAVGPPNPARDGEEP